jgi:predicted O-linked N-acetylglucosamine transferase (SPINDLY family)
VAPVSQLLQNGLAAFNAGRHADAEKAFRAVLAADPKNADALNLLGLSAMRAGRPEEGAASIARAVALRPSEPSFRLNLGVALKAAGKRSDALSAFREAVRLAPGYAQAHLNIGNTLREDGDLEGAAAAYIRTLDVAPNSPAVLNNLGNVQREMRDFAAAVATYRKAVALAPDYVEALTNLGSAALAGGEIDIAVDALRRAATLNPQSALIQTILGRTLVYASQVEEAETAYKRATELAPDEIEPRTDLADLYSRLGLVEPALEVLAELDRLVPVTLERLSTLLFLTNYQEVADPMKVTEAARRFGAAVDRSHQVERPPLDHDPSQPLRVGIASGDFRHHVVMEFILSILPHIDPRRVELFAYSSTPVRDDLTADLQALIPNWRDVEKLDDAALAARIVADRIHVLIDLNGHTQHTRLQAFAMRPAPVQATWLGYSGTTGVDEIDFIIGDRFVTPPDEEAQLIETPWRMPDSYLCYTVPKHDASVGSLPALTAGHVTFGSFNNLGKLSDATLTLWSELLDTVAGGRLLIKSQALSDPRVLRETAARFAAHNIDVERVTFLGRIPGHAGHLNAYNRMDIALDPFPYNGTTTTAEALWMGVPVLTLHGSRFIGHVGESILNSAGLPDWVAADRADFIHKAVSFAADLDGLAALRARLRDQFVASPVCDAPRFARNLEDAVYGMWHQKIGDPRR